MASALLCHDPRHDDLRQTLVDAVIAAARVADEHPNTWNRAKLHDALDELKRWDEQERITR